MNPKLFGAFLVGLAVASGVTYYLMSKPEPAKTAAVQTATTPAPAQQEPAPAATQDQAPAPAPAAAPAPEPVKPSPVMKQAHRGKRAEHTHTTVSHAGNHSTTPPTVISTTSTAPPAQQAPKTDQEKVDAAWNLPPPPPKNSTPARVEPPPPPKPNTVTIPAGTLLSVRMGETLNSERNREGDTFSATLEQPLVVDGFVIAERGSRAQGRIVQALRSGRVEGLAKLGVELTQINTSDGQKVHVNTGAFERTADSTKKADALKIGAGAAIGAAIGGIAGGGKGAGIGAAIGGGAGAGGVMLTRGKPAELPVETRVSFRLKDPVTITEKLRD